MAETIFSIYPNEMKSIDMWLWGASELNQLNYHLESSLARLLSREQKASFIFYLHVRFKSFFFFLNLLGESKGI